MNQDSFLCHQHSLSNDNKSYISSSSTEISKKKSIKKRKHDNVISKSSSSSNSSHIRSSFYDGGRLYTHNEDSFIQIPSISDDNSMNQSVIYCWAVFDGHDLLGEYASSKASECFDHYISSLYSIKLTDSDIKKAFLNVHKEIIQIYNNCPNQCLYISSNKSKLTEYKHIMKDNQHYYVSNNQYRPLEFGTTALLCILIKETKELIIAWAGDSQAKMISSNDGYDDLYFESLIETHCHRNNKEKNRIKNLNLDGVKINEDGYYISLDNKLMHHLSLTRALGHKKYSEYGIIPDPQIKRLKLDRNHRYLIIGSDGKSKLIH